MILAEIFWTFFKIGAFSFGGGYAMIPLITRELVHHHRWVTMEQLVDMITVSQMTPGPFAINIATFAGYNVAGVAGSTVATLGVVTPAALILVIGVTYFLKHHDHAVVQAVLKGIRPVIVALIAYAGFNLAQGVMTGPVPVMVCLAALLASHYWRVHPILALSAGGILGLVLYFL